MRGWSRRLTVVGVTLVSICIVGADAAAPVPRALASTAAPSVSTAAAPDPRAPLAVTASSPIILQSAGSIRVRKESAAATCAGADFGIATPTNQEMLTNYLSLTDGTVSAAVGPFNAGQTLTFYIRPYTPGAICAQGTFLSTDPQYALVFQLDADHWLIRFEDHPGDPNDPPGGDYDDLVVQVARVEGTPTNPLFIQPPPSLTKFGPPWKSSAVSRDPVNTFTGAYSYSKLDLELPGRGPFPSVLRSYNSADTRIGLLGPGWTTSYETRVASPGDGTNDVVLVGPQGRSDRYTRNADGTFSSPQGVFVRLERQSDGTYVATLPDQLKWRFDESGRLVRVEDRYGNAALLHYDGTTRKLIDVVDPAGRGSISLTYGSNGRLASIADWVGRVLNYTYDAQDRLATVTDREGNTTRFAYSGSTQLLTTLIDSRGVTIVSNSYDGSGRVLTQRDGGGFQTSVQYLQNANGNRTTVVTYPPAAFDTSWNPRVEDNYDQFGQLTSRLSKPTRTSTEWTTDTFGYDGGSNLIAMVDGRGSTTSFCYDGNGNVTRRIDPAPSAGAVRPVTLLFYDARNNVVRTVPPKGVASTATVTCATPLDVVSTYATDYEFDPSLTQLVSLTRRYTDPTQGPMVSSTRFEPDSANPGIVGRVVSPRGFPTDLKYAASGSTAGLLSTLTNSLGNATSYEHDAAGRVTKIIDAQGRSWNFGWDREDRVTSVEGPAASDGPRAIARSFYDGEANEVTVIDQLGQVMRTVYDERGKPQEVRQSPDLWTDPNIEPTNKIVTRYGYDNEGNIRRVTRAVGTTDERAVDYFYDGMSRLRKEAQYPSWPSTSGSLVTQYSYDLNSNRSRLVDPLGRTTSYTFDPLNRLVAIGYSDGKTPSVAYSYDANGNRAAMSDGTGSTTFAYDELDRLTSIAKPSVGTVKYRYDQDGNRVLITYPDGTSVRYAYNAGNQLDSVIDWANRQTHYSYYPDGSVQALQQYDGTSTEYSYDGAGRLVQVWNKYGAGTISRHTYQLNQAGDRVRADEVLPYRYDPGPITSDRLGTISYDYDRLRRMTRESRQMPFPQDTEAISYTYDRVGNRLTKTVSQPPFNPDVTTFVYDRADRIKTATGDLKATYTVDANGNLTSHGSSSRYTYDQANRMTVAHPTIFDFVYKYDGDGTRTSALTPFNSWNYTWDLGRDVPALLQDGTRKYVWGMNVLYSVNAKDEGMTYNLDGLGSVRALTTDTTSPSMRIVQTYITDAFGVPGNEAGIFDQFLEFAGEQKDHDTGFSYLRARFYDPTIGRFLSRDPIRGMALQPFTLNGFTYVNNNPANWVDPKGQFLPVVALVAGAAFIAVTVGLTNPQQLSDDGKGGEAMVPYLTRIAGEIAISAATDKLFVDPLKTLVSKAIHPAYPLVGRLAKFPNEAWWWGVRRQVQAGRLAVEVGDLIWDFREMLFGQNK